MYRTILFYVGKKNIILNEQAFTLGQLTAEILNITPRKFQRMRVVCFHAEDEINRYIQTKDRSLGAGHVIRQCECCRRYFLLTKGYHTKYCDHPNPDNPKYTCAQLGYRQTGMKEAARDDPKKQALLRCYQRLNKDVSRGNLTSEQRDVLYSKAEDLHHEARLNPEITFEAFDRSLATDHLCQLFNITRTVKKAGRPRKNS